MPIMIQTRDHEMSTNPDPQNTPSVGFQNVTYLRNLRCNFRPIFFNFGTKIHFYDNFLAMHCFSLDSISLYFTLFSVYSRLPDCVTHPTSLCLLYIILIVCNILFVGTVYV